MVIEPERTNSKRYTTVDRAVLLNRYVAVTYRATRRRAPRRNQWRHHRSPARHALRPAVAASARPAVEADCDSAP